MLYKLSEKRLNEAIYKHLMVLLENNKLPTNAEIYLEWLNQIGIQGELPYQKNKVNDIISYEIDNAQNQFSHNDAHYDDYNTYIVFMLYSHTNELSILISDKSIIHETKYTLLNKYYDFHKAYPQFTFLDDESNYEWLPNVDEIRNCLTNTGKQYIKNIMNYTIDKTEFNESIHTDKRNLIYIERMFSIPLNLNPNKYYNYLSQKKTVGDYWSFTNGHIASSDFNGKKINVLLKGWVSPLSINWNSTLQYLCSSWSYETEAILQNNTTIELSEIDFLDYGIKKNLSILVKTNI